VFFEELYKKILYKTFSDREVKVRRIKILSLIIKISVFAQKFIFECILLINDIVLFKIRANMSPY